MEGPPPDKASALRWLGSLLVVTSVLLGLQIFLGVVSHSLTLLADAPHATLDVLTYAFNYWIEWLKDHAVGARIVLCGRRFKQWKVDAVASLVSVFVLLLTMGVVVVDLLGELYDLGHEDAEAEELYMMRGSALFLFALLSTVCNVAVLVLQRYWRPRRRAPSASWRGLESSPAESSPAESLPAESLPADGFRQPPLALPPLGLNVPQPRQAASDGGNGCPPRPLPPRLAAQRPAPRLFEELTPEICMVCDDGAADPGEGKSAWISFAHSVVHPGCAGHGGLCSHNDASTPKIDEDGVQSAGVREDKNLNVDSALLHVVSDVFRGVLIFVLALMIQLGVVVNAKKADAICAMLVAVLVFVGAGALFRRAYAIFGCRCLGGGFLYAKFCEDASDGAGDDVATKGPMDHPATGRPQRMVDELQASVIGVKAPEAGGA
mmetsp:Transcript_36471/g.100440  ORF Transcript_36471/g.100440 Transcript_36471/m.100440 type:complete len:435 (-) Transcript_36471:20-1324(-)|eukprot:CAMPEP_0117507052 /NCGR_PEP_ID=MMETSP0784-20121206/26227_1 /TAXON_ID=39447 /ORGANISM="" /LENGTH=434 /DNA_ID=CAMNT_0005302549 /DNA_START=43 /DNA_END=1347 /DNA_ORIENTATION=+